MPRRRPNWRACESAKPLESGNLGEIFRATRGNPLFVVESVRAGLQSTRVHAVIAARLAQLTAASYELAGLASVVGRPFSFELLEKATDWDEASVSQALDELWRRRIIESRGASEYDFTHDRLREVACAELSLVRQRYLHRRVARALAEVYGGRHRKLERADCLAFRTGRNGRRGDRALPAGGCLCAAAVCGHRSGGPAEARPGAVPGFPESDRRLKQELDLLVTLGPALVTTEGYSAAEVGETYERALELSRRLDDRNIFVILSGAWVFHVVRGDLEKARQFSLEFLRAGGTGADSGADAGREFPPGKQPVSSGPTGSVARPYDRGHPRITAAPRNPCWRCSPGPDIGVFCRSYLAHLAWHREDAKQRGCSRRGSDRGGRRACAIRSARRSRWTMPRCCTSSRARAARRWNAGGKPWNCAAAMASLITWRWRMSSRAGREAAEGDVAAGLAQLREGLDGMRRLGAELRLPYYFALLAETFGRAGLIGEALASLSTGFAFASKNGEEWAVAELHRVQGESAGRRRKARSGARQLPARLEAAQRSGSLAFERRLSILADGTAAAASTERS